MPFGICIKMDWTCPDTIHGRHGPEDVQGKCPWCRKKTAPKRMMPKAEPIKSEALLSYEYYWDPDFGNNPYDRY